MNYDEIPEWIRIPTLDSDPIENGLVDKYNFVKGSYVGHVLKLADYEARIDELEEQVEIARAYERERIARYLLATGWHHLAEQVRNEEHYEGGLQ